MALWICATFAACRASAAVSLARTAMSYNAWCARYRYALSSGAAPPLNQTESVGHVLMYAVYNPSPSASKHSSAHSTCNSSAGRSSVSWVALPTTTPQQWQRSRGRGQYNQLPLPLPWRTSGDAHRTCPTPHVDLLVKHLRLHVVHAVSALDAAFAIQPRCLGFLRQQQLGVRLALGLVTFLDLVLEKIASLGRDVGRPPETRRTVLGAPADQGDVPRHGAVHIHRRGAAEQPVHRRCRRTQPRVEHRARRAALHTGSQRLRPSPRCIARSCRRLCFTRAASARASAQQEGGNARVGRRGWGCACEDHRPRRHRPRRRARAGRWRLVDHGVACREVCFPRAALGVGKRACKHNHFGDVACEMARCVAHRIARTEAHRQQSGHCRDGGATDVDLQAPVDPQTLLGNARMCSGGSRVKHGRQHYASSSHVDAAAIVLTGVVQHGNNIFRTVSAGSLEGDAVGQRARIGWIWVRGGVPQRRHSRAAHVGRRVRPCDNNNSFRARQRLDKWRRHS
eukprot:m.200445 g.200445  ORF g.200445 m.200445 type:complete len:511 (-) comp18794_c0_seq1:1069-2601(-)